VVRIRTRKKATDKKNRVNQFFPKLVSFAF
jgi:hypothetical protein